ncbi:hypothetical protein F5882DRAFT_441732 [Hyaloscypha sp. PMI_1271]|nr:hypothetical protein F5882DRAFT_441732 [Hyaloscypha sp. PMI_1271]
MYGNAPKISAAGRLGKRMRSNSNEDSISRISQVQAWLKDQATAEDFEKIWRIFLDPTASSSTYAYRGADLSYQGNSHLKAIDLMADIPVQSSISADPVLTPGLGLLGDCGQYQNCVHPTSFNTDFDMNSSSGQASNLSVVSPAESNYSALPSRSMTSLRSEPSDNNAVAAATLILRQKCVRSKQDRTRDSAQSTSSYSSMNSDMSTRMELKVFFRFVGRRPVSFIAQKAFPEADAFVGKEAP